MNGMLRVQWHNMGCHFLYQANKANLSSNRLHHTILAAQYPLRWCSPIREPTPGLQVCNITARFYRQVQIYLILNNPCNRHSSRAFNNTGDKSSRQDFLQPLLKVNGDRRKLGLGYLRQSVRRVHSGVELVNLGENIKSARVDLGVITINDCLPVKLL
jgi:hypothetical protein